MDLEMLRSLFAYDHWVNDRLMGVVQLVSDERLHEPMGGSFDTIFGTTAHILQGEMFYYYRWTGQEQPGTSRPSEKRTIAELRDLSVQHRRLMDQFLRELAPDAAHAPIRYGRRGGEVFYELPLWQIMLQVVNHGTHHRAELADMLTRVGHPPPPTDLIVYYQEQAGPAS